MAQLAKGVFVAIFASALCVLIGGVLIFLVKGPHSPWTVFVMEFD